MRMEAVVGQARRQSLLHRINGRHYTGVRRLDQGELGIIRKIPARRRATAGISDFSERQPAS